MYIASIAVSATDINDSMNEYHDMMNDMISYEEKRRQRTAADKWYVAAH